MDSVREYAVVNTADVTAQGKKGEKNRREKAYSQRFVPILTFFVLGVLTVNILWLFVFIEIEQGSFFHARWNFASAMAVLVYK